MLSVERRRLSADCSSEYALRVSVRFGPQRPRLRCASAAGYPSTWHVGGVTWRISLGFYGKGSGKAEIIAVGNNGRRGTFIDGRAELVERALRFGVCVPVGTVRYRLALALAAIGKAELDFGSDDTL